MASSDYIDVPIVTDPDELVALFIQSVQSKVPGWVPNDGNFETIFGEGLALIASVVAYKASGAPTSIFRWYGPLAGIAPISATQAVVQSTWVARDNQGYSIAAGTIVGIRAAGDVLVPFTVLNQVDIPNGETTTDAGAVTLIAVNAGAAGSGLGSPGGPVELVDPLDWVSSITQVDITTGGVDAEADIDYRNRLRAELALQTPRPILPPDFAALGRTIPGVYRMVAIDGYNPGDNTYGNARMIALAGMDANGNNISAPTKTAVDAFMQAMREVNFVVNVMDPHVTEIDVTYQIAVADGFDPTDTLASTDAAVIAFLSAKNWGIPANGDPTKWEDVTELRYLDLAHAIRRTPGVEYINALTFGVHGGALAAVDVALAGPAALPHPHTITGTHT